MTKPLLFTWETARGITLATDYWGISVLRGRRLKGRETTGLFTFPGGRVEKDRAPELPAEILDVYAKHKLMIPAKDDFGGETSLRTAIRETFEETGLVTAPLFVRHPPIQVSPEGRNMVVHYHLLVKVGGKLRASDELDSLAFVRPENMLSKHESGRMPFMETDLAAWQQVLQHQLLPGMANFHPRIGAWPRSRKGHWITSWPLKRETPVPQGAEASA